MNIRDLVKKLMDGELEERKNRPNVLRWKDQRPVDVGLEPIDRTVKAPWRDIGQDVSRRAGRPPKTSRRKRP